MKLTGTTLTVIALHIDSLSSSQLLQQLSDKVQQAPQFFHQSPIIIDLGQLTPDDIHIDLNQLIDHCHCIGLQPMAFKNVNTAIEANELELPILLSTSKDKTIDFTASDAQQVPATAAPVSSPAAPIRETVTEVITEEKLVSRPSKVIHRPIRSGQQVYAEGTDLIILAQVSEGAEVIADGNIHVYGALRGRALAGVKGDTSARIFCQQMNAELIAIAGNFLLSDNISDEFLTQPVQISLSEDRLVTELLK